MKKNIKLIAAAFLIGGALLSLSACKDSAKEEAHAQIATQIDTLGKDMDTLFSTAEDYYKNKGTITDELYGKIQVLQSDYNDVKDLFTSSEGYGNDEQIRTKLTEITAKLGEYQKEIKDTMGSVADTDVVEYAQELLESADELRPYVNDAYTTNKITEQRYNEFNSAYTKLQTIKNQTGNELESRSSLVDIKSTLSAIASEVGASRSIIDKLVGISDINEGSTEATTSSKKKSTTETTTKKKNTSETDNDEIVYSEDDYSESYDENVEDDYYDENNDDYSSEADYSEQQQEEVAVGNPEINEVVDNYTNFQNQASRDYERGKISEEDYNKLLDAGNQLSDAQQQGDTQKAEDVKNELYSIADSVGYSDKDEFK